MNIGIILAAGKGSRLKCKTQNKTSLELWGKPMVRYGVELFEQTVDQTIVVVGAFPESVKEAVGNHTVKYANQTKRLGTGHALKVAMRAITQTKKTPNLIFLGYGDHMVSYTKESVIQMSSTHAQENATITLVTAVAPNPEGLGRIVRAKDGTVKGIVEQKDATPAQREIHEVNAGFYCFSYDFLKKNINKLKKSSVTGEYYLTDLISMAQDKGLKIAAHVVPFEEVGTGVNTREQLDEYAASKSVAHKSIRSDRAPMRLSLA
ncbi:MAG: sugar phosphate nucleotidyltransferase [Candidatus Woesebacteria bacterium]